MRDRIPLLAGLTLLAIALLIGSLAIAGGISNRGNNDTLTVTGSAKKAIVADYAIWSASLTAQDLDAGRAAKQVGAWSKRVQAFLRQQGVRDAELSILPISIQTVTDSNGELSGYQVTRTFEVRSTRVGAITSLADAVAGLVTQGVPVSPSPTQYIYTQLKSLRPQLLAEAVKDAQARAKVLVQATGAHLGKIRGVDVGVFQVTSPNSTDVSDYGVYDTSTLHKDVTAVVNLTFALG